MRKEKPSVRAIASLDIVPFHTVACPEFERAVLGAVLLDGGIAQDVVDRVAESDWYESSHRIIAETIRDLLREGAPVEPVTIGHALGTRLQSIGGPVYLGRLIRFAGPSASIPFYCSRIVDRAAKRRMVEEVILGMDKNVDAATMAATVAQALESTAALSATCNQVGKIAGDRIARIEAAQADGHSLAGIPFPWMLMTDKTGGMFPCDSYILAGRPSMGKTAFSIQLALGVAGMGYCVLFASREMDEGSLTDRMLACLAGVRYKHVREGTATTAELNMLKAQQPALDALPLHIFTKKAMTARDIRTQAARYPAESTLVIVDYLQLLDSDGSRKDRRQEIGDLSRYIKDSAKELRQAWVTLSQLRRIGDSSSANHKVKNPRPQMQDLKESGDIEQDADGIWMLHRDDYESESGPISQLEVLIRKGRNSGTGTVQLEYNRDFQVIR